MNTTINNNERLFYLRGTGWNSQHYACNMADIVRCAKEFEDHQPYEIYHIWNGRLQKCRINYIIDMLDAAKLDSSLFKRKAKTRKNTK